MTWLMFWFMLFISCIAVFLLGGIVRRLEKRWRELSHFVCNEVGGVTAYCAISDFKRGHLINRNGYRIVPETLVYCVKWPGPVPGRFINISKAEWYGFFHGAHREWKLFVPFTSEAILPFEEQAALIIPPPSDVNAFITTKKAANRKADFRLAFNRWITAYDGEIAFVRGVAVLVALFALCALCFAALDRYGESRQNEQAVYYTTTAGSAKVTEHRATRKKLWEMPMTFSDVGSTVIVTGPVTEVMHIGGGLDYVGFLRQSTGSHLFGFAPTDQNLRPGDIAYVRFGSAAIWGDRTNLKRRENIHWLITEQEARALVDKGFTIRE